MSNNKFNGIYLGLGKSKTAAHRLFIYDLFFEHQDWLAQPQAARTHSYSIIFIPFFRFQVHSVLPSVHILFSSSFFCSMKIRDRDKYAAVYGTAHGRRYS